MTQEKPNVQGNQPAPPPKSEPLIPKCDVCKKDMLSCKCKHNELKK